MGLTEPNLTNDGCFTPKHELIRLISSNAMRHGIISKHQQWNMQRPTALLFFWERLQETWKCTIESLTDGISTWIVRHGHRLLDVIHGVQFGNNCIFKTSALITVNVGWNPIDIKPFVN